MNLRPLFIIMALVAAQGLTATALAEPLISAQTTVTRNFAATLKTPATVTSLTSYITIPPVRPSTVVPLVPGSVKDIITDIIVDTDQNTISESEIWKFLSDASKLMRLRTGSVGFRLRHIYYHSFRTISPALRFQNEDRTNHFYESFYRDRTPPEFLLLLHANKKAALSGAYTYGYPMSRPYCNRYRSAAFVSGNTRHLFASLVHWDHFYNACGYDHTDPLRLVRTRTTSAGGECRNERGTPCTYSYTLDHFVCSPMDSYDLYGRSKRAFIATAMVHEIMHHFGREGDLDHFATLNCDARMGSTAYRSDYTAYQQWQKYYGQCPDLYTNIHNLFDDVCNGYDTAPYGRTGSPPPSAALSLAYSDRFIWRVPADPIRSWSRITNDRREGVEVANGDSSQYFHLIGTDRTLKTPTGYVSQGSYRGDCYRPPAGQSCITFSDGYAWLVQDTSFSSLTRTTAAWDGRGIEFISGANSAYKHILGTPYVTWGNKNLPETPEDLSRMFWDAFPPY